MHICWFSSSSIILSWISYLHIRQNKQFEHVNMSPGTLQYAGHFSLFADRSLRHLKNLYQGALELFWWLMVAQHLTKTLNVCHPSPFNVIVLFYPIYLRDFGPKTFAQIQKIFAAHWWKGLQHLHLNIKWQITSNQIPTLRTRSPLRAEYSNTIL